MQKIQIGQRYSLVYYPMIAEIFSIKGNKVICKTIIGNLTYPTGGTFISIQLKANPDSLGDWKLLPNQDKSNEI